MQREKNSVVAGLREQPLRIQVRRHWFLPADVIASGDPV